MENKKIPTVSVSQVNKAVAMLIKGDRRFSELCVKGEIADFTRHFKTGHLYFTLCDETAKLKAVMWKNDAQCLKFSPEDGDSVICRGSLTVYEPSGVYQINAVSMEKSGEGEAARELAALIEKLTKEGVFAQKRKIPEFPRKIAVITSAGGAALQDIINITSRRCPTVRLCVIPALVQGAGAPESIVRAFKAAQGCGADTIIFGRGGGSADDLSAFNDERVARAIFESEIPTISAVGHETDVTVADMAADMRAPTPSAAAELATPDISEVRRRFEDALSRIRAKAALKISACEAALLERERLVTALSPRNKIAEKERTIERLSEDIARKMRRKTEGLDAALERYIGVISALSPLETLRRGFSVTEKNGKIIKSAGELSAGDRVKIRFSSGSAEAEIIGAFCEE